ncbi:HEAT repeat domain-containing protein [Parvularcula dongshanensis]|uniref:HEAT repeat domain-containing protein n=1 Tax=Parvularcula dongshanensis TaxID=1173995 RepID=UPI001614750D
MAHRRAGRDDAAWELLAVLHRRGAPTDVEAAVGMADSEDPIEREAAADLLARIGWSARPSGFTSKAVPVLSRLLADVSPAVQAAAIHGLYHQDAAEVLLDHLQLASHEDAEVRHAVASCLPGDEEAGWQTLILLSADEDATVRDWATFSLGAQSDADGPEIRAALTARLSDEDEDTRTEAIYGLAKRQVPEGIEALKAALCEKEPLTILLEVAGLSRVPELIPFLEARLGEFEDDADLNAALEILREAASAD